MAELKLDARQLGSRACTLPAIQSGAQGPAQDWRGAQGRAQNPRGAPRPLPGTSPLGVASPSPGGEGWHPLVLEASPALVDFDCNQIKSINKIY